MKTSKITTNAGGVPFIGNIPAFSVRTTLIEHKKDYAKVMQIFPELDTADIRAVEQYFSMTE